MARTHIAAQRWLRTTGGTNRLAQVPAVVLTLALVAALLGCGGGGGVASDTTSVEGPTQRRVLQASEPGQLLAYMKAKLSQRQQLRAERRSSDMDFSSDGKPMVASPVFSAGSAGPAPERSSTVIQEDGVDEDDTIKSNGSLIATLNYSSGVVAVRRALPEGPAELIAQLPIQGDSEDRTVYNGMYMTDAPARLSVLGSYQHNFYLEPCRPTSSCESTTLLWASPLHTRSTVSLDIVNLDNPGAPVVSDKVRIDGSLVGSRLIGNSLVLVTEFTPALIADALPWDAPEATVNAALKGVTVSDLLPTIRINGGEATALVQETDCFIEPKNASYALQITSITVIDLSSAGLQRSSRCFVGGSDALYMSTSTLYLATTSYPVQPTLNGSRLIYAPQTSTDIHKFALIKGPNDPVATVDFRGSGSVIGHLGWNTQQRSHRMSEYNGDLRVLTFTGGSGWSILSDASNPNAPAPSPAKLTVLREAPTGRALEVVGQLPNPSRPQAIGKPGEQVYAVRFIGDRGYVVTFRRVDPLYVLDLSKPNDPAVTGELTVAGFSDYLFPVGPTGSGLLLGVGKDADESGFTTGVKVALFDVADPKNPIQRSTVTIGQSGSQSALDYSRHGIDLFTRDQQTRAVLPIATSHDMRTPTGPMYSTFATLQRFEIDATTRSMTLLAPLSVTDDHRWIGKDRSLQMGDMVHHFIPSTHPDTAGNFLSYKW